MLGQVFERFVEKVPSLSWGARRWSGYWALTASICGRGAPRRSHTRARACFPPFMT